MRSGSSRCRLRSGRGPDRILGGAAQGSETPDTASASLAYALKTAFSKINLTKLEGLVLVN